MAGPPRLAEGLLRALLPKGLSGESTLGDLEAEYWSDVTTHGGTTARVRYVRVALAVSLRYLVERGLRVVRRRGPSRTQREGMGMGKGLAQDVGYALRTLAREPGWSAATLATLALGIGATTAVFTVVNGVLLQPLEFPDSQELALLELRAADPATVAEWAGHDERTSRHSRYHVNYPDFLTWADATGDLFTQVGVYDDAWTHDIGLGEGEGTVRLAGTFVSSGLLQALGTAPAKGRLLVADDDAQGAEPVVVISHRMWIRRMGGDPDVVGRIVTVARTPHTIVGVMPPGFSFPSASNDVWISMATASRGLGSVNYQMLGRIRRDFELEGADAGLTGRTVRVVGRDEVERSYGASLVSLHDYLVGETRSLILLFASAVSVLLLVAGVNVVSLVLARSTRRSHERTIRVALGAGPGRITQQLLTESVTVSVLAVIPALAAAWALTRGLQVWIPEAFPRRETIALDGTVALFALALATLVGVFVGVAPAFQASRRRLSSTLNDASRGSSGGVRQQRSRDILVVFQLALSLVLLVTGGLLTRSLVGQLRSETGFEPRQVLKVDTSLPRDRYDTPEKSQAFFDALLEELGALPGVRSAAAVTYAPASGFFHSMGFEVDRYEAMPGEELEAEYLQVTPDYFATLGIPLLGGRSLDGSDGQDGADVVVVSESFAAKYFPMDGAVGGRIRFNDRWRTVIGVAGDVHYRGATRVAPVIYEPWAASARRGGRSVMLKTDGDPELLGGAVTRMVAALDPQVAVYGVTPLETQLWGAVAGLRLRALLLGGMALMSLLLSVVGVYSVMAYAVTQRTRELGIRRVLGAHASGIIRSVVRRGLGLTVLGILLGAAGSVAASGIMESWLPDVDGHDPLTVILSVLLLGAASVCASLIPAMRAARVDPVVAFRTE